MAATLRRRSSWGPVCVVGLLSLLFLLSCAPCFATAAPRQPLLGTHMRPHDLRTPARAQAQLGQGQVTLKSLREVAGSFISFRMLLSFLAGSLIGSLQYLCVISRHLQECEMTLKADRMARHYLRPSGNSLGWCTWAASSAWTWLFADVSRKASLLETTIKASSGLLLGILGVQLLWTSISWLKGSAEDEKIGIRMWKTIVIWVGAVGASSACCNFALHKLCVRSSWTGLPYNDEGHVLCALFSILGGGAASAILSSGLRNIQDRWADHLLLL